MSDLATRSMRSLLVTAVSLLGTTGSSSAADPKERDREAPDVLPKKLIYSICPESRKARQDFQPRGQRRERSHSAS